MTKVFVYDLETYETDRTRPYAFSFYQFRKLLGKYNRDLPPYGLGKCRKDTFVFDEENFITKALDYLSKFKGEEQKF